MENKTEIYKGYEIDLTANEWLFFEAIKLNDCDAPILICKTVEQLKDLIDDLDGE